MNNFINTCGCGSPILPPVANDKCRATLPSTSIDELIWLQGLADVNGALCERFQRLSDILGLRDCNNNIISSTTPIVTCAAFKDKLCSIIAGLVPGGEAVVGVTQLVGADCKTYTIPSGGGGGTETPNTATDTNSIDTVASGTLGRNISANVKISSDLGNAISIHGDGIYALTPTTPLTACQQIQGFSNGADAIPGTVLVGADCLLHVLADTPSITVTDTSSVNLTLTGTNLSADVRLDADFIGRITADGLELTCADVLTCAPPVTVIDSLTINHTLVGQQLQSDVIVDPNAGNDVSIQPTGIRVDICNKLSGRPLTGPAVPGVTQLIGKDCTAYTLPTTNSTTVSDTNSVNMSLIGTDIHADVIIDPEPTNLLVSGINGLDVSCEAVQDCTFNIANNFFAYNDVIPRLDFTPSADAGNQIVLGADGKPFVGALSIGVTDTSCINLTLVGNTISADPIISPNANNGITCIGNGLYAPSFDVGITAGTPGNCIQVVVSEPTTNNFEIGATPVVSPDAGNVLECRANGMFAPGSTNTVSDTNTVDLTLSGNNISADVIISPDAGNILVGLGNGLFVPTSSVPFTFTSALALSHNIIHNRGNSFPLITVWDTATNKVIIPDDITSNTTNDLTITFFVARAIAGTIA